MTQVSGSRLTEFMEKRIQELVDEGMYTSVSEFIRDAVREKLEDIEVMDLRDISYKEAKKEILNYIKSKGRAWTSEIADDLRLDLEIVVKVLNELSNEGKIK